tara:strand:+ start:2224 stop:2739 length:516 start_codon:yes stop_codon:yes gene_type:complete
MLNKSQKEEIVSIYRDSFSDTPSFLLINFKGAKVSEFEELRNKLRVNDTKLSVVKNNLLKKASKDTDLEQLFQDTKGETAIAFLGDNYVEATKAFIEIQKDHPSLAIKLGFIEGKHLNESELEAISKLPSREILLSQLLSQLKQPVVKFLGVSKAIPMKLVILLNNLKNKK